MTTEPIATAATVPAKKIVLNWTVTQQYRREFTPEQWASAMDWFDDVDPADLDECYNRIERQDWKAEEFLTECASDRWWVDTDEGSDQRLAGVDRWRGAMQ